MTTRREILGGLGALSIPIIGDASPVKSMLGGNGTQNTDSAEGVQNPYVTDGLLAMWDGEWNAGLGVHAPEITEWRDIVHGLPMSFVGEYTIKDNSVFIGGVNNSYGVVSDLTYGNPVTQEVAFYIYNVQNYGRVFAEGRGLCTRIYFNTAGADWGLYGCGKDTGHSSGTYRPNSTSFSFVAYGEGGLGAAYVRGTKIKEITGLTSPTYSGMTYFMNRSNFGRGISADVYRIAVYNRALTDDEIAQNYQVDKERFNLP